MRCKHLVLVPDAHPGECQGKSRSTWTRPHRCPACLSLRAPVCVTGKPEVLFADAPRTLETAGAKQWPHPGKQLQHCPDKDKLISLSKAVRDHADPKSPWTQSSQNCESPVCRKAASPGDRWSKPGPHLRKQVQHCPDQNRLNLNVKDHERP